MVNASFASFNNDQGEVLFCLTFSSLSGSPTNICQQQRRRPSNQKSSLSPGTKHRSKCKGGPYRDLDTLMELQLNKVRFDGWSNVG